MKNANELADAVFRARDAHREAQQNRIRKIRTSAVIGTAACAICLTAAGVGYGRRLPDRMPSVPQKAEMEGTQAAVQTALLPEENTVPETTAAFTECEPAADAPMSTTAVCVPEGTALCTQVSSEPAHNVEVKTEAPTAETEEYIEEPRWDEKTISEQFVTFTNENGEFVSRCTQIDRVHLGERLYDAVIEGYDGYADEIRYADASVYRIIGIEPECAVAVRFQGCDTDFVYTNHHDYMPKTLGEMMDALHLSETISFHTLYAEQGGSITDYDRSLLLSLLEQHRDLPLLEDDTHHRKLFGVSTNIDLLGIVNKSLAVTEDGYLTTNLMERRYTFCIGEETALALADALGIEKAAVIPETDDASAIVTEPAVPEIAIE